uniref:Uncharacterized protein DKFZp762B162 n=1 Tax=Homo sapiens TaxID=9606 RepID=Q69YQ6_HUMAN|nr:hypothetical protein [Homo sapiens]
MEMSLVLLFLIRTALFAPQGAAAEPHSLCYNLTVLSRDGSVQSGFLAEGHLDGQLFLLCDRQKGRAGPRGQWAEAVLGAETWDTETEDLTENGQELRRTLDHIKGQKGGRGDKYMKVLFGTEFNREERDSITHQCWVSSSCNFRTTMNTKRILKSQSCLERGSHL